MSKYDNILETSNCPTDDQLIGYATGGLRPAEKHAVERHLIDCEICSDMVEGLKNSGTRTDINHAMHELDNRIKQKVARPAKGKQVFLFNYRTSIAIAASVALILGTVWYFRNNEAVRQIDSGTAEKMFADNFEPYDANSPSPDKAAETKIDSDSKGELELASRKENGNSTWSDDRSSKVDINKNTSENSQSAMAADAEAMIAEPAAEASSLQPDRPIEKAAQEDSKKEEERPVNSNINTVPVAGAAAPSKAYSESDQIALSDKEAEKKSTAETSARRSKKAKSNNVNPRFMAKDAQPSAAAPPSAQEGATIESRTLAIKADSIGPESRLERGMESYNKGDYQNAVLEFEKELAVNPSNERALFYASVSYLSIGKPDKTISGLNRLLQNPSSEFFDAAQWYLALAYVKQKDAESARQNLRQIQSNEKSRYRKQADELLKELDR